MAKLRPFDKIEKVRSITGLTSTQKLLLLIIATHLGKNEFCYISITTFQEECCLKKRDAITDNLQVLIDLNLIWKLPPSKGYKSNRYGINFDLLVTVGDWTSHRRLLDQSPTVTRLVTVGDSKRNRKEIEKKLKENLVDNSNGKAKENVEQVWDEIRQKCGIRKH